MRYHLSYHDLVIESQQIGVYLFEQFNTGFDELVFLGEPIDVLDGKVLYPLLYEPVIF